MFKFENDKCYRMPVHFGGWSTPVKLLGGNLIVQAVIPVAYAYVQYEIYGYTLQELLLNECLFAAGINNVNNPKGVRVWNTIESIFAEKPLW